MTEYILAGLNRILHNINVKMKAQQLFKILIVLTVALSGPRLKAKNSCSDFFGSKPTKIARTEPKFESKIQDLEWMKTQLFERGELKKLLKSDFQRGHSEFLSELLYETVNLLNRDFYREGSEFQKIEKAESLLREIISDIKKHREGRRVSREYFIFINHAIARFINWKDLSDNWDSHDGGSLNSRFKMELASGRKPGELLAELKAMGADLSAYPHDKLLLLPMFPELSKENFLELGIEIAPLGMTFRPNLEYDNLSNATSHNFFLHDLAHASIYAYLYDAKVDLSRYFKINEFLKTKSRYLTTEENIAVTEYLFEKIHESSKYAELIEMFYSSKGSIKDIPKNDQATAHVAIREALGREKTENLTPKESSRLLKSWLKKLVREFQKQNP